MDQHEDDLQWEELLAVRTELDDGAVVVPIRRDAVDGSVRELSPKARRFAEAMSISMSWSAFGDARDRLSA